MRCGLLGAMLVTLSAPFPIWLSTSYIQDCLFASHALCVCWVHLHHFYLSHCYFWRICMCHFKCALCTSHLCSSCCKDIFSSAISMCSHILILVSPFFIAFFMILNTDSLLTFAFNYLCLLPYLWICHFYSMWLSTMPSFKVCSFCFNNFACADHLM